LHIVELKHRRKEQGGRREEGGWRMEEEGLDLPSEPFLQERWALPTDNLPLVVGARIRTGYR
jgi:hypothetical protein